MTMRKTHSIIVGTMRSAESRQAQCYRIVPSTYPSEEIPKCQETTAWQIKMPTCRKCIKASCCTHQKGGEEECEARRGVYYFPREELCKVGSRVKCTAAQEESRVNGKPWQKTGERARGWQHANAKGAHGARTRRTGRSSAAGGAARR